MRLGLAADHGGFNLKRDVATLLASAGHEIADFGAELLDPADDYPDFVTALAQAVAMGHVERGIAICGSGVGASICANKIPGVRAALVHDHYSAQQGVEHDDMNILCIGARVIGPAVAADLIATFLAATFTGDERHRRRLAKIAALESNRVQ